MTVAFTVLCFVFGCGFVFGAMFVLVTYGLKYYFRRWRNPYALAQED